MAPDFQNLPNTHTASTKINTTKYVRCGRVHDRMADRSSLPLYLLSLCGGYAQRMSQREDRDKFMGDSKCRKKLKQYVWNSLQNPIIIE